MWKAIPLNLGTLYLTTVGQRAAKRRTWDHASDAHGLPCISWLLIDQQSGKKVLVDAGPSKDPARDSRLHGKIERSEEQYLENALKAYDTAPEEISLVIATHLHWDHILGVAELLQARVVAQRAELAYAVAPMPFEYGAYELNDKDQPPIFMRFLQRIDCVDGDTWLTDGLSVLSLPGHSPGSQGVRVETEDGVYLIVGDALDGYENLEEAVPTCMYSNLTEWYSSYAKIREQHLRFGAKVFPGHDEAVWTLWAGKEAASCGR